MSIEMQCRYWAKKHGRVYIVCAPLYLDGEYRMIGDGRIAIPDAFFKVVLHEIWPAILSGALMAFTMSLDDFVISYFVTGSGFVTLPVEIYSYTKKPIQPKVYAMFTLIFVTILLLMVTMNLLQARDSAKKTRKLRHREANR